MSDNSLRPRRSALKILVLSFSGLLLFLFIGLLCVPTLLSTSAGRNLVMRMVNKKGSTELAIEELTLSWFGSQSIRGLHWQEPKEQLSLECREVSTDASLWHILFKNDLGTLNIIAPRLQIAKPFISSHSWHPPKLQAASLMAAPEIQFGFSEWNLPIMGHVHVKEGEVRFNPPGLDPIRFDGIEGLIDRTMRESLNLNLNCSTTQQNLQGQISLLGSVSKLGTPFPSVNLTSTLSNLPVRGIDQLIALFSPDLNGVLYSALGDTLDMQCNVAVAADNVSLNLNARTPQMSAQLTTQASGGILSLQKPASFTLNVTPALWEKIKGFSSSMQSVGLTQPVTLGATLSSFSCPSPQVASDLLQAAFEARLSASAPISLVVDDKSLVISDLKISGSSPMLDKEVTLKLAATSQTGSLALEGTLKSPWSGACQGSLALNASKLPLSLVSPSLATWVGDTADIQGSIQMGGVSPQLHLAWQSPLLSIPSLDLSLGKTYALLAAAPFTLQINPQFAKAGPIQGNLDTLIFSPQDLKNAKLNARLQSGPITLKKWAPLSCAELGVALNVNSLDQIVLNIQGSPLAVTLVGALNPAASKFTLSKPLTVEYIVDSATLQALVPNAPALTQPAALRLVVEPLTIPLDGLGVNTVHVKGQLTSNQISLAARGNPITLQNTTLPFQWNASSKTASLQLSSSVQNPAGDVGSMQAQADVAGFLDAGSLSFDKARVQGTLDLQNISSTLLEAFSKVEGVSALIGPSFNAKLKVQSAPDEKSVALKWSSANLNLDSAFLVDKTQIRLQGAPAQLAWTLTPEAYRAVDKLVVKSSTSLIPFEVKEPSTWTLSISKCVLPLQADMSQLELSLTGRNPALNFFDTTSNEGIQLSNLSLALSKNGKSSPFTCSLDSSVVTQTAATATKSGSISVSGSLEQTLDAQGGFDLSKLTCGLQMKVQQLPSRALDLFARAKGRTEMPFTTIFGDMINASLSLNLKNFTGAVALNLNTPGVKADVAGQLTNGALTLNRAVHAQMKVTPEMSRLVLKEVNPLNLSYIYSQAPLTLEVPAEGFYLPLYPADARKIVVPDATIELGRVSCRNEGNVHIALGLLKTKQFDKKGELTLWFAPIDLSIQQGIVNIERTEILLADTFDVCLWGSVDLVKDYIDMVLGLTAQTLSKAFGIKKLPENYVLTIPMKGKADNVQINSGKATAKIAMLLAWQNKDVAGAIGGPAGALVGEMLGRMATLPDADMKIPPAKHPFPWEVGRGSKTSQTSHEKKREFKAHDKPLKQILKVIR